MKFSRRKSAFKRISIPKSTALAVALLPILAYSLACNIDHGLAPEDPFQEVQHGIRGKIIFEYGEAWPQDIAETRLVVSRQPPLELSADAEGIIFSDPIPAGVDTFEYVLELDPGTYRFIAVLAREKDRGWNISNVVGIYSEFRGFLGIVFPDSVVVATDTTIVDGVDITADLTRGSISGTVTFEGPWPENTLVAGVAVYAQYPPPFILGLSGLALIPSEVSTFEYRALVPDGRYEGIIAVVLTEDDLQNIGSLKLEDIQVGIYADPADPTQPGVVEVTNGEDVEGIDIQADLKRLQSIAIPEGRP